MSWIDWAWRANVGLWPGSNPRALWMELSLALYPANDILRNSHWAVAEHIIAFFTGNDQGVFILRIVFKIFGRFT